MKRFVNVKSSGNVFPQSQRSEASNNYCSPTACKRQADLENVTIVSMKNGSLVWWYHTMYRAQGNWREQQDDPSNQNSIWTYWWVGSIHFL